MEATGYYTDFNHGRYSSGSRRVYTEPLYRDNAETTLSSKAQQIIDQGKAVAKEILDKKHHSTSYKPSSHIHHHHYAPYRSSWGWGGGGSIFSPFSSSHVHHHHARRSDKERKENNIF